MNLFNNEDDFKKETEPTLVFSDEKMLLKEKMKCITRLLMTNDEKNKINIEKLLLKDINNHYFKSQEKITQTDAFLYCGNAMMKYKTIEWINCTGIELFWRIYKILFEQELQAKIQILYFLMRNEIQDFRRREIIDDLKNISTNIANNPQILNNELANFIDLLLNCGDLELENIGNNLLQILRDREYTANIQTRSTIKIKNIYSDGQNVHNSDINNSVLEALDKLCQDYHKEEYKYKILTESPIDVLENIKNYINDLYSKDKNINKINNSINRISTDLAIFSKQKLRLRDIMQKVWNRIMNVMNEEISKEAIARLTQELIEMDGLCSTGHMSRIINVLSGFSEDNGGMIVVKISFDSQIKSNILARINFKIKNMVNEDEKDKILESMIETEQSKRDYYVNYVKSIKNEIFVELEKEFSPMFDVKFTSKKFSEIFESNYLLFQL